MGMQQTKKASSQEKKNLFYRMIILPIEWKDIFESNISDKAFNTQNVQRTHITKNNLIKI